MARECGTLLILGKWFPSDKLKSYCLAEGVTLHTGERLRGRKAYPFGM